MGRSDNKKEATELKQLFQLINEEIGCGQFNVEEIQQLIETYRSSAGDWKTFSYDNPKESYSRNLVLDNRGQYNAIIIVWQPEKGSKIHVHENSNCFFKVLQGNLQEEQFLWPDEVGTPMKLKQERVYRLNEVNYMTDEKGLHRVTNVSDHELAVSLHIYMPSFKQCSWFVEETGKANRAQMTFASVDGKPTGDFNKLAESCLQQCVCKR